MSVDGTSGRRVLLAGTSGLVGGEVLTQLLADSSVTEVIALARRPLARTPGARLRIAVVDFDRLDADPELFRINQIFCALGTTIKKAGSQEAFRRVDLEYPLRIAKLGLAGGAHHFLLVSAAGANSSSRVFYSRVKAELEDRIRALGYRSFTIARPSLLVGARDEYRLGEVIASKLSLFMPTRWKPVHARQVAAALVHAARVDAPGVRVIANPELRSYPG
ncbi:MAG: hypothetical protein ABI877_22865 [Gemmatimonadaceae bacterium]